MNFVYKVKNVGATAQEALAESLDKNVFLTLKLVNDWKRVCPEFAGFAKPLKIHIKQKLLILFVEEGYEMDVQYSVSDILYKINRYFGRSYISNIMIKKDLSGN